MSLRILPLGASITWGLASSTGNGYRKSLRDSLRSAGFEVTMVGSKHNGDMDNNNVEANSGDTIDQIKAAAANSIKFKPNVVLINAGTNDCHLNVDIPNAGNRIRSLIDYLHGAPDMKDSLIVLSTLLHSWQPEVAAHQPVVNRQYRDLVKTMRSEGIPVVLAEMDPPDADPNRDWYANRKYFADDTHPNDEGYALMASVWYQSLLDAYNEGLIKNPVGTSSPVNGPRHEVDNGGCRLY